MNKDMRCMPLTDVSGQAYMIPHTDILGFYPVKVQGPDGVVVDAVQVIAVVAVMPGTVADNMAALAAQLVDAAKPPPLLWTPDRPLMG